MKKIIPIITLCFLLLAGCGNQAITGAENTDGSQTAEQGINGSDDESREPAPKDPKTEINLALKPNEAGKIMVLMYHNIGDEEEEWVRTPDNFKKDMETLYEKGYRPISLTEYVSGNITTEQGFTPVVITFDDGNLNNFEYMEDGSIRGDSAVGLLMGFHEEHKDFPLEATFFLYGERPFRQNDMVSEKLNFIVENGMDIGNHTKEHNSFKKASMEEIQEQIGAEAQFLETELNRSGYQINTMALPFGERPKDEALMNYLAKGSYNGVSYENVAILNVGWNPAYSPYDSKFDHTSIPRIRASEMKVDNVGLYNYLSYFDKHPEEKFISDGVAEVITIPEAKKEAIRSDIDRDIYLY